MRPPLKWIPGGSTSLAAVAVIAVLLSGGLQGRADPDDPAQVAQGKAIYAEECASCHGVRLEGQPGWRTRQVDGRLPAPPHDGSGHSWHHPDAVLFEMTKEGVAALAPPGYESDMPAFEGVLSDSEVWAVLAFVKSTWPGEIRRHAATPPSRSRQSDETQPSTVHRAPFAFP